jgi:hypothetical protein
MFIYNGTLVFSDVDRDLLTPIQLLEPREKVSW